LVALAVLAPGSPRTADAQLPSRPTPPSPSATGALATTAPLTITSPVLSGAVYAGVRTTVKVRVANAKPGSTILVKPLPGTAGSCAFVTPAGAAPATAVVNGTTEVSVAGMFPHPASGLATACEFKAEVTATKTDGSVTTSTVSSTSVPIAAPQTYVVTSTADWLQKFAFANTSARGDCTGLSGGPNGSFKVGLVTSEAGQAMADLTFKIRSGPTGTSCRWQSQPILLPEGVRLTAIEMGVDASGPCSATPSSMPPFAGGFQSSANPVTAGGAVVGANPIGAGYTVNGIAPLSLQLTCGNTLSNDRFVTVVIKSLTFVGPPNVAGFP
jgi:hypothetical protein